jgi:hypothetical protein
MNSQLLSSSIQYILSSVHFVTFGCTRKNGTCHRSLLTSQHQKATKAQTSDSTEPNKIKFNLHRISPPTGNFIPFTAPWHPRFGSRQSVTPFRPSRKQKKYLAEWARRHLKYCQPDQIFQVSKQYHRTSCPNNKLEGNDLRGTRRFHGSVPCDWVKRREREGREYRRRMLTLDMRMMRRSKSKRFLFSSFIFFAPCFAMAALLEVLLLRLTSPLRLVLGTWGSSCVYWQSPSRELISSRTNLGPGRFLLICLGWTGFWGPLTR